MTEAAQADEPVERFDAIVIGTGFAGAVTACRLVQAGQRICVLERGRRYEADDLPVYPDGRTGPKAADGAADGAEYVQPDLSRLFWKLGQGLWDVRSLGDVVVGQAAGYGGGSLIYANVHLRAPADAFDPRHWPFTRADLEDYYDLAAFMLGVEPANQPATLPKTRQLEQAAQGLERDTFFFRLPLAIRFAGEEKENDWGRPQATCDMRGDCAFGCRRQAKNTVDLNYLAIAEDRFDAGRGEFLADIRTLAEVKSIEALGDREHSRGYRVHYVDHLARCAPRPVDAPYVFLCAGAINTTELLLRSREQRNLQVDGAEMLGRRYHPNADALVAVFDCDAPQEADRGPTITGALLHRDGRHWLMVQDGGMPAALEPFLGFFRSPLWARRNRHREGESSPDTRPRVARLAKLPFGGLLDVLSGITRSALQPGLSQTRVLLEHLLGDRPLPPTLEDDYQEIRGELLEDLVSAVEPRVDDFLVKSADRIEAVYELERDLFRQFTPRGFDPSGIQELHLPRQILRLGLQLVWGSQGDLVGKIADEGLRELVPEQQAWLDLVVGLLRWALDYRIADGHTALLLCMGRDSAPGRLSLEAGRVRAQLPNPEETPERSVQEQLLRDIAATWGGELRTDPTWSFLGSRITVHSQGGCPMGGDARTGVTDADGQVFGCTGLYVMDAAAFPTSVGVNPSATIESIAERKIERFIRSHVPRKKEWVADERPRVTSWAERPEAERAALDPIGAIDPALQSPQPTHEPIGIEFKEKMTGYYDAADRNGLLITEQPGEALLAREPFEEAERAGIRHSASIETDLTARIEDLALFLEAHRKGRRTRIHVDGTLTLRLGTGRELEGAIAADDRSYLELQPAAGGERARELYYELHVTLSEEPWLLRGRKLIRDDPSFDIWEDTATLFFELWKLDGSGPFCRGVLRLTAANFFNYQLPSFQVKGTREPTRRIWALAAFGQYFFGQLVDVYLPELGRAGAFVKELARRIHV